MNSYKPENYNSLSPYLIVDNAKKLVEILIKIFDAKVLRRYDRGDGKIGHIELKLDDSVIMLSDSTKDYSAQKTMLHMYVPNVFETMDKALDLGCELIEQPINKEGDSDTRGSFYDHAGNYWAISTQTNAG